VSDPNDRPLCAIESALIDRYGWIVGGDELVRLLGYPSQGAFRQALSRGLVPVPVFQIAHRQGKFAWVPDVAQWLRGVRATADRPKGGNMNTS
jgi:hypothetical protein